jgi:hypothetical protein
MPVAGFIWLLLGLTLLGESFIQFISTWYLVTEGAGPAAATVQRANDLDRIVTVDYATSDGTAIAGEDYLATSGTLTFAAGQTEQTLSVVILNDALVEGTEMFLITLSNPGAGASLGPRTSSSVRIRDNDTGPHFTSTIYATVQDVGTLWIGVHRGDDGDQPVTVGYATQDGTALAGQHYEAASGTLRFEGDEFFASIPVVILNAGIEEADKTFQIQLADASSGGVGLPSLASVRIQDPTPMFYTQPTPANQSVSLGAVVKIQVSAKGARMQWQHRVGEGEFTDIPGATGEVLEWSSATVDLSGEYRFVVSSSTGESVTSQIAAVSVDPTFIKITGQPIVEDVEPSGNLRVVGLRRGRFGRLVWCATGWPLGHRFPIPSIAIRAMGLSPRSSSCLTTAFPGRLWIVYARQIMTMTDVQTSLWADYLARAGFYSNQGAGQFTLLRETASPPCTTVHGMTSTRTVGWICSSSAPAGCELFETLGLEPISGLHHR